jgi:hypothetical protein
MVHSTTYNQTKGVASIKLLKRRQIAVAVKEVIGLLSRLQKRFKNIQTVIPNPASEPYAIEQEV